MDAEQRHWEQHVESLLGPDDEAFPEVDHAQKLDLLRRGRAFVFPIRWQEPFGLVMIEALACGMPVVATPFGAAAEIVEDGVSGFLRRDLDGLTAALRDIDRIPAEACRARVESRFSADEMLGRYDRLFAMLAGGRAGTRTGRGSSCSRLTVVAPRAPDSARGARPTEARLERRHQQSICRTHLVRRYRTTIRPQRRYAMTTIDIWRYRDPAVTARNVVGYDVEALDDAGIGKVDDATDDVAGSYLIIDTAR